MALDSVRWLCSVWVIAASRRPNVVSMLAQRRRHWANIETTLGQVLVFAGISQYDTVLSVFMYARAGLLQNNH